ncbi:MAG: DUF47 family protein [Candidatus Saganbacteria bacterium]|nr:DUF47 family protein [Candidatus Saganbacteria bacterium]
MIFRLFPKDFSFFELFKEQVDCAVEAAAYFKEMVLKGSVDHHSLDKIHHIENRADDVAHKIIDQLNKCFIAPFDREDIHNLTIQIDDIVDIINAIASHMKIYKISKVDKGLVEFAAVIEESVQAVARAVNGLSNVKKPKAILEACVEVNRLENVGDAMRDELLAELFESETNPIEVIKWKEIYQDAETVLDICEDVAHVVDTILVKHT